MWEIINFWAGHFVFGAGALLVLISAALAYRTGTPAQRNAVLKTMCAIGAACIAAEVPGLLSLQLGTWLSGAGALAVFFIVFWWWPTG